MLAKLGAKFSARRHMVLFSLAPVGKSLFALLNAGRIEAYRYLLLVSVFCLVGNVGAQQAENDPFSLTLDAAEQQLLIRSPDVAIGRAAVAGAAAGIQSAKAGPNPILGLSTAGIDPHAGVGNGHLGDKRADSILSLSQTFERGNKRELRTAAANANLSAAEKDLDEILREQRIAVATAFYDLLAAQQRAALAADNARLARRSVTIAETRMAAGDLARVDVARARTDAARAETDADQARAELQQARTQLAMLLDLGKQASTLHADGAWPAPRGVEAAAELDLETLLAKRPDVAAARARVEAARASCDLARAQQSRDVTVGVQVEHNPQNPQLTHGPLYGVSISIPLLFGNDYRGDISKSEADYTVALETLRKVESGARAELENHRFALDMLGDRARRFSEELLPEARRAASAAEFAFEHGAIGVGDLLDARRTLKTAELDAVATQDDHAKAFYAWLVEISDARRAISQEMYR